MTSLTRFNPQSPGAMGWHNCAMFFHIMFSLSFCFFSLSFCFFSLQIFSFFTRSQVHIEKLKDSRCPDTQQRCYEMLALKARPALMRAVLPLDSSLEDLEVDPDLPWLNGVVQAALRNGARPYVCLRPTPACPPLQHLCRSARTNHVSGGHVHPFPVYLHLSRRVKFSFLGGPWSSTFPSS
jgi:hypothetical protein